MDDSPLESRNGGDGGWLARSAWQLRSPEFGPLVSDAGTIGIELAGLHDELGRQWVALPRYPTIIQALRPTRLRYAAIDWTTRPITLGDAQSHSAIATRGIELAQTLEWLLQNVKVDNAIFRIATSAGSCTSSVS